MYIPSRLYIVGALLGSYFTVYNTYDILIIVYTCNDLLEPFVVVNIYLCYLLFFIAYILLFYLLLVVVLLLLNFSPASCAWHHSDQSMHWYATANTDPYALSQNILMAAFTNHLLLYIAFFLSICSTAYSDELDAASDFPCPISKEECGSLCKNSN